MNTCVYLNKKIEFCGGSIRSQVYEMWSFGERVACGVITEDTKVRQLHSNWRLKSINIKFNYRLFSGRLPAWFTCLSRWAQKCGILISTETYILKRQLMGFSLTWCRSGRFVLFYCGYILSLINKIIESWQQSWSHHRTFFENILQSKQPRWISSLHERVSAEGLQGQILWGFLQVNMPSTQNLHTLYAF